MTNMLADLLLIATAPAPAPAGSTSMLDPTLQVFLSIFGGALVAAGAGLTGAAIQARQEHRRWLRERRYEAFARTYALLKGFDLNWSKQMKIATKHDPSTPNSADDLDRIKRLQEEADELYTTVATEMAPLLILGPSNVAWAALEAQVAYESDNRETQADRENEFIRLAQQTLKVRKSDRIRQRG